MASEEEGELKVPEEMFKDVKFYAVGDIDPQVTLLGRAHLPPSPGRGTARSSTGRTFQWLLPPSPRPPRALTAAGAGFGRARLLNSGGGDIGRVLNHHGGEGEKRVGALAAVNGLELPARPFFSSLPALRCPEAPQALERPGAQGGGGEEDGCCCRPATPARMLGLCYAWLCLWSLKGKAPSRPRPLI